jgi:hypothetical protein
MSLALVYNIVPKALVAHHSQIRPLNSVHLSLVDQSPLKASFTWIISRLGALPVRVGELITELIPEARIEDFLLYHTGIAEDVSFVVLRSLIEI